MAFELWEDELHGHRRIKSIEYSIGEGYGDFQVGRSGPGGAEQIKAEGGPHLLWFAVYVGDEIRYRINGKYVISVTYEEALKTVETLKTVR